MLIGPWLENIGWAAAFTLIVIFADGWWKLMAFAALAAVNSVTGIRLKTGQRKRED